MKNYINSFLAGIMISLGCTVYLSIKNLFIGANIIGAFLFAIGLLTICIKKYDLYTGKVCYMLSNKELSISKILNIFLYNGFGCSFTALLIWLSNKSDIILVAQDICLNKLTMSYSQLFILGFICNIFIFIAVDGYKNCRHELGKYLSIFLGVMCFILTGTEHSIADIYYFLISGFLYTSPLDVIGRILIIALGNLFGGLFIQYLKK